MKDQIFEKYLVEDFREFHPDYFHMMMNARAMVESIDWATAKVEVVENSKNKFKATFASEDLNYYFEMTRIGASNVWVSTYDLSGSKIEDRTIFDKLKSGKIHNGVFAAVVKCLREFIDKVKPEHITFSSADERLILFYRNMQKYLTKHLPLTFVKEVESEGNTVGWLYKVKGS